MASPNGQLAVEVVGPFQRHDLAAASELLHGCGLGSGRVAARSKVERGQQAAINAGLAPDAARRLRENYVVARLDSRVIGAARFHPSTEWVCRVAVDLGQPDQASALTRRVMLAHLAVLPEFRGRGYGSRLLAGVVEAARSQGDEMVWGFAEASLDPNRKPTTEENERLRGFYERNGFSTGGDSTHTPVEIYGPEAAHTITLRVGTYFWKVL